MRPALKPLLTVGAAVMVVTTACADDSTNADDTTPNTAQPAATETTEPAREPDGVLTIGLLLPQTGEGAAIGGPGVAAADRAVGEINEAGGVLGVDVQVVRADEGATLEEARAGVESLLSQNVDAIVGPASSNVALDVLDDLMTAGVVTCSPTATSLALDNAPNRDRFFRTISSDSLAAQGIAKQAQRTGVTAATVVYVDDAFGRPFARAVTNALRDSRVSVNPEVRLVPGQDDYQDSALQLAEGEPGTIIVIADSATGWAMLLAMSAVITAPPRIIVNDAMRATPSPEQVAALPVEFREAIEGVAPLGNPQFAEEPVGPFATYSYDCVNLIALSAVVAESDQSDAIADQMVRVARDGAGCTTFASCVENVDRDRDIDYNGPRQRLILAANGDPALASLVTFKFDELGLDQDTGPIRIND